MQAEHLEAVCALERRAHAHPWSEQQFADALQAGHGAQLLLCGPFVAGQQEGYSEDFTLPDGRLLLGYCVAQTVLDEVHLHNLATARPRQGWGRRLLQRLIDTAQAQGAQTLWLEVRASNLPARALYQRAGFEAVATRFGYYPAQGGGSEDALVLRRCLQALPVATQPTEPEPA
ncbi:MAG: hypothetical protein B7Y96_05455 [Comamonadaceae bacterium 32-67-11]|nr:MAG: hypothetical protein B7Y96_05455 [Comamonadaceae bacterium 32-67-11]